MLNRTRLPLVESVTCLCYYQGSSGLARDLERPPGGRLAATKHARDRVVRAGADDVLRSTRQHRHYGNSRYDWTW